MNTEYVRDFVQTTSAVVVAGALAVGAASTSSAATPAGPAEPEPSVTQTAELPATPFPAEEMAAAAQKAQQIEVQREKRARELAQRSSGQMYTPTTNYQYSARFGQPGGWSSGHHTGLDFAAPSGTPVFSALAGTVVEAGWGGAYANIVIVKHSNGIKTLYAHLSSSTVTVGDKVLRGQRIGTVGTTGNSTGPHLHFEVIRSGTQRNPADFL